MKFLPPPSPGVGLLAASLSFSVVCVSAASAQTGGLPGRPVWEAVPTEPLQTSLQWTAVDGFANLPTQFRPVPSTTSPAILAVKPRVEAPYKGRGIYGVGGGVRSSYNTGDTTAAVITGRVGYKLDEVFSISLRPSGIFGPNNDSVNNNNNNNNNYNGFELRVPLTLDLFHSSFISPYVGGGIAYNTDNLGYTDGMLTGGADINITKWIAIGLNINYIYQTNINDTDWEALGLLYLRF